MPFYFLCRHRKFVTMSVMLTYLMLQIGLTKINFCHVSFAPISNGLKIGKVFLFNTYLTQININSTLIFLMHNFRIKYQESNIGFENLAHLQSIQNKGDIYG